MSHEWQSGWMLNGCVFISKIPESIPFEALHESVSSAWKCSRCGGIRACPDRPGSNDLVGFPGRGIMRCEVAEGGEGRDR